MDVAPNDNSGSRWGGPKFSARTVPAEGEIPWASMAAWQECRLSLGKTIAASRADLGHALALAERIVHRYGLIGDLFDAIAESTCAVCVHPCCLDARVWLDFKDLLLMHLTGQVPPPGQLRRNWRSHCRYLTARGCALSRAARPWVCTWYICPLQRRVLQRDLPGGPERFRRWWPEITILRERMETAFVTAARR